MADDEQFVEQETAAAEREAAEVGGGPSEASGDPAQVPIEEGGGGEAEGFELAEQELRDHAEHRDAGGNPRYDRPDPEADRSDAVYGEADHAESNEDADGASEG